MPDQEQPLWKKLAGEYLIDTPANLVKGALGIDPAQDESGPGYIANALSQLYSAGEGLVKAGLPFAAITKGKPVFHGSQRVFDKFNPEHYDTSDVLGWMTHFAKDPEYASQYAVGGVKSHFGIPGQYGPNVIAAEPQAKNVLDLVNPNIDDLSQAIASLNPEKRRNVIANFKNVRAESKDPTNKNYANVLSSTHYPDRYNLPREEVPVRFLAERLRLDPEEFKKTPFDAIRYHDIENESYAIPEGTPIRSFYSKQPLTHDPTPLKVVKAPDTHPVSPAVDMLERKPPKPQLYKDPEGAGPKPGVVRQSIKDHPLEGLNSDKIDDLYYNNVISADEKHYLSNKLYQSMSKYKSSKKYESLLIDEFFSKSNIKPKGSEDLGSFLGKGPVKIPEKEVKFTDFEKKAFDALNKDNLLPEDIKNKIMSSTIEKNKFFDDMLGAGKWPPGAWNSLVKHGVIKGTTGVK